MAMKPAKEQERAELQLPEQIRVSALERPLSPAQKRFNRLTEQIAKKKNLLLEWQQYSTQFDELYHGRLRPIHSELQAQQKNLLQLLEQQFLTLRLGRRQQGQLAELIAELAAALFEETGEEEWKQIYDRYKVSSFDDPSDEIAEHALAAVRNMLQEQLGVDIPEDMEFANPDDLMDYVRDQLGHAREQRRDTQHEYAAHPRQRAAKKQDQEQQHAGQRSLQSVYRQLIAQLHPDREPDPTRRAHKTELMKQVTVAYERGDLLQLLELQLSLEQIDQAQLNALSEERLAQFNRVLKQQLEQLDREVDAVAVRYEVAMNLEPGRRLRPVQIITQLKREIKACERAILAIRHDQRLFADERTLRALLKTL